MSAPVDSQNTLVLHVTAHHHCPHCTTPKLLKTSGGAIKLNPEPADEIWPCRGTVSRSKRHLFLVLFRNLVRMTHAYVHLQFPLVSDGLLILYVIWVSLLFFILLVLSGFFPVGLGYGFRLLILFRAVRCVVLSSAFAFIFPLISWSPFTRLLFGKQSGALLQMGYL